MKTVTLLLVIIIGICLSARTGGKVSLYVEWYFRPLETSQYNPVDRAEVVFGGIDASRCDNLLMWILS